MLEYYLKRLRYTLPNLNTPPKAVGHETFSPTLDANGKESIWRAQQRLYTTGMNPAVSLHLHHKGEAVYHRAIGYKNPELGQPLALDTPICLFSASKAVTALLVHHLVTQGELELDKPVAHYLPEYGQNGKHRTTIQHLLTHRAGIAKPPKDTPREVLFQPDAILKLLYEAEPMNPGRQQAYHAVSAGFVLGVLIEKITGKTLNQFLDEIVRQPMGMKYFTYGLDAAYKPAMNVATGVPSAILNRFLEHAVGTDLETVVDISNTAEFRQTTIPAGNLYATAEETSRFFQMLLADGTYQGKKVFDKTTVQRATARTGKGTRLDRSLFLPMEFSAGFMLGAPLLSIYGPGTAQAFGHLGFLSIYAWADRERDLAGALLTTGKGILGAHIPFLLALQRRINRWTKP